MDKYSISNHWDNEGNFLHNTRQETKKEARENIDESLSYKNEILRATPVEVMYEKLFQKYYEEWQNGVKRERNKSPYATYYEHVTNSKQYERKTKRKGFKSKKDEFNGYKEVIIQIGDRNSIGQTGEKAEAAHQVLKEYFEYFERTNKTLIIANAAIHRDEPNGTAHLHMQVIPVAGGFKNGMKYQVSMKGALRQLGFDTKKKTYWNDFNKRERQKLLELAKAHGLECTLKTGDRRFKHLNDAEYIELSKEREKIKTEREAIKKEQEEISNVKKSQAAERKTLAHERGELDKKYEERDNLDEKISQLEYKKAICEGEVESLENQKKALKDDIEEGLRIKMNRENRRDQLTVFLNKLKDADITCLQFAYRTEIYAGKNNSDWHIAKFGDEYFDLRGVKNVMGFAEDIIRSGIKNRREYHVKVLGSPHFWQLDDIKPAQLKRIIADFGQPLFITETSPSNFTVGLAADSKSDLGFEEQECIREYLIKEYDADPYGSRNAHFFRLPCLERLDFDFVPPITCGEITDLSKFKAIVKNYMPQYRKNKAETEKYKRNWNIKMDDAPDWFIQKFRTRREELRGKFDYPEIEIYAACKDLIRSGKKNGNEERYAGYLSSILEKLEVPKPEELLTTALAEVEMGR